jgi:prevent-host-death family protein
VFKLNKENIYKKVLNCLFERREQNATTNFMEKIAVNEFRRQVGEYINQVHYAGKGFVLTKGEKRMAALVPISLLDRLAALEKQLTQAPDGQPNSECPPVELP